MKETCNFYFFLGFPHYSTKLFYDIESWKIVKSPSVRILPVCIIFLPYEPARSTVIKSPVESPPLPSRGIFLETFGHFLIVRSLWLVYDRGYVPMALFCCHCWRSCHGKLTLILQKNPPPATTTVCTRFGRFSTVCSVRRRLRSGCHEIWSIMFRVNTFPFHSWSLPLSYDNEKIHWLHFLLSFKITLRLSWKNFFVFL